MSAMRGDAVPRVAQAPHKLHNPVARPGKAATALLGLFPALPNLPVRADGPKRAKFLFFTIGPLGQKRAGNF